MSAFPRISSDRCDMRESGQLPRSPKRSNCVEVSWLVPMKRSNNHPEREILTKYLAIDRLQRCRAGDIVAAGVKGGLNFLFADITNSLTTAAYRQRITRFTEALDFVSKADMDWAMGRGILERLKWA